MAGLISKIVRELAAEGRPVEEAIAAGARKGIDEETIVSAWNQAKHQSGRDMPVPQLQSADTKIAPLMADSATDAVEVTAKRKLLPSQESIEPNMDATKAVAGPADSQTKFMDGTSTAPAAKQSLLPSRSTLGVLGGSAAALGGAAALLSGDKYSMTQENRMPTAAAKEAPEQPVVESPDLEKIFPRQPEGGQQANEDPVSASVTQASDAMQSVATAANEIEGTHPDIATSLRTSIQDSLAEIKAINANMLAAQKEASDQGKKEMFDARMAEAMTAFAQAVVKYANATAGVRQKLNTAQYYDAKPADFTPIYDQIKSDLKEKLTSIQQQAEAGLGVQKQIQDQAFKSAEKQDDRAFKAAESQDERAFTAARDEAKANSELERDKMKMKEKYNYDMLSAQQKHAFDMALQKSKNATDLAVADKRAAGDANMLLKVLPFVGQAASAQDRSLQDTKKSFEDSLKSVDREKNNSTKFAILKELANQAGIPIPENTDWFGNSGQVAALKAKLTAHAQTLPSTGEKSKQFQSLVDSAIPGAAPAAPQSAPAPTKASPVEGEYATISGKRAKFVNGQWREVLSK